MKANNLIKLYFKEKASIADNIEIETIHILSEKLIDTYDNDGTVFVMANGGGASAAEGFATDLRTHPFVLDDKSETTNIRRLKVVALTESSGALTGISNDIGYDFIFSEQLKNFMRSPEINKNDLVIAFSGSGNSKNIINAINYAKEYSVFTSCISGRGGGKLKVIADLSVIIQGTSNFPGQTGKNDNNFHIEDFQVSITHILTGMLRNHVEK